MSGGDSDFDDVPEGGFDWAGDWSTVHVTDQCGSDHVQGDCICLRLVRLDPATGGYVIDSDLSWDDYIPMFRYDQAGGDESYSSEADSSRMLTAPDYYHPYFDPKRYDSDLSSGDLAGAVYVVPVNLFPDGLDGVPTDMSAYSCEACRKLSPDYTGYQTEGPMYGVDDGGAFDELMADSGRLDVIRGETDCRGLKWYLAWLEEYESYHVAGGSEWAISSLFQKSNFDYLHPDDVKDETIDYSGYTSYGVNDSVQWRFAWFMPYYAKFFESLETESYRMRFFLFEGWGLADHPGHTRTFERGGYTFLKDLEHTANRWMDGVVSTDGDSPSYWLNMSIGSDGGVDASAEYAASGFDEGTFMQPNATARSMDQYLRSEYYDIDTSDTRKPHKRTIRHVADSPVWSKVNGKYMFLSKTTFEDRNRFEDDSDAKWHRMLWPLCAYDSSQRQHGETSDDYAGRNYLGVRTYGGSFPKFNGSDYGEGVSSRIGMQLSSGNPRVRRIRTTTNRHDYYVEYNPNEREGLIEKFGPYHFIDEAHQDWNVSFGGYNESWVAGFQSDRRTIAQVALWYNYYTDMVHQAWAYEENREEGMERMKSDLAFTKVKARKYDAKKIYSIANESQPQMQQTQFATNETTDVTAATVTVMSETSDSGGGGSTGGGGYS